MMDDAKQLVIRKDYEGAQEQYKKIMKVYPNYENAYKEYYFLEYKITGPLGLTQSLFENLQKKYLDAVDKYGDYREEPSNSPKV